MIRRASLLAALLTASGAAALDLPGNARLTAERVTERDRYNAPVAPFDGTAIPVQSVDGQIVRRTWQIPGVNVTPLQVLSPLRAQYEAAGYETVLDCVEKRCGGFDFRFGTEILPAPAMFVNLQKFHVLTMRKGPPDAPEAMVSLLASASANVAHLQIIEARAEKDAGLLDVAAPETDGPGPPKEPEAPLPPVAEPASPPPQDLKQGLERLGFHVLGGLEFETGETALGPGPFAVLEELAEYLSANPRQRIALVGHTDTVGSLEGNIAISRARAQAVRQRLIEVYGIDPARLDVEGVGYLAPRAANRTAEGREANRRVEVVLLASP